MNKYAIAVISLLDNDNEVFVETALNELSAMKKAVISFIEDGKESDFMPLLNAATTPEELKKSLFQCEIGISDALLIL